MNEKSPTMKFVVKYAGAIGVALLGVFIYGAKMYYESSEKTRSEQDAVRKVKRSENIAELESRFFDDQTKMEILNQADKVHLTDLEATKDLWKIDISSLTQDDFKISTCEMQADISQYLLGEWQHSKNTTDAELWRTNRKQIFNLMQIMCLQSLYGQVVLGTEKIEEALNRKEISILEVANLVKKLFINQQVSKKYNSLSSLTAGEFKVIQLTDSEISAIESALKSSNLVVQGHSFTEPFKKLVAEKLLSLEK